MALSDKDMGLLERRFAMYILLSVDKHPLSTKKEIIKLSEGFEKTKFIRIQELMDAGLIEYRKNADTRNRAKIVLTEDGKKIVASIKVIRRVLSKLSEEDPDD
jgi:hypothetical protein